MGYVPCRSCDGLGIKFVTRDGRHGVYTKELPCRACDGTGINQRLYSKNCEKCYTEIVYPRDAIYPPKYCKSCKAEIQAEKERKAAEWKSTRCKICGTEIKYNINWSRIPDTCKPCIELEKAKWREKSCKNCGTTIKYHIEWSKIPDLCKSCVEKEKAKWKEAKCKICGSTIRYNTDWTRIPDTCKPCIDKEKAMWAEKPCKKCNSKIRYRKDWSNIPELCKNCKEKADIEREKRLNAMKAQESYFKSKAFSELQGIAASVVIHALDERSSRLYKANAETNREARKWKESDCKFRVISKWDRENEKPTTDIQIYVNGYRGHYHFVADDEGRTIISEWRDK